MYLKQTHNIMYLFFNEIDIEYSCVELFGFKFSKIDKKYAKVLLDRYKG